MKSGQANATEDQECVSHLRGAVRSSVGGSRCVLCAEVESSNIWHIFPLDKLSNFADGDRAAFVSKCETT
jgi:hypothetical protein